MSALWNTFDEGDCLTVIIFRYLARELLSTMLAISFVILLISLSGRFVRYLADAASGKLDASVLFIIMGYRIPGFLELILPLGLFLGILFAYGKLYMESEMTVLRACGFSQNRILAYTLPPTFLVAVIVAVLSLWITPAGVQKTEDTLEQQSERSEFESLQAARFQSLHGDSSIIYVDSKNPDRTVLDHVFMAQMGVSDMADSELAVVVAESAVRINSKEYQQRYLQLQNGSRYLGRPGSADYQVTEFDSFNQHLSSGDNGISRPVKVMAMPTAALLQSTELKHQAALQWRLSMPLLVLVVAILAVPLSKTNPRQGRYMKMIPAILLYFIYLASLTFAKSAVEDGRLPVAIGIWWVHGIFLLFAVYLYGDGRWAQKIKLLCQSKKAVQHA
jgi:lipopolysaccharide export system permease protein